MDASLIVDPVLVLVDDNWDGSLESIVSVCDLAISTSAPKWSIITYSRFTG